MSLKTHSWFLIWAMLAFTGIARGADPGDGTATTLQTVRLFAIGGVGITGVMSEGERALRTILAQPNATGRLQRLLESASPAGQLYALLGLRLADRGAYERALPNYQRRNDVVGTIRGCILGPGEPFSDLVRQIQRGNYDTVASRPAW